MKTYRVRSWLLSGVLACSLLAGCSASGPVASTPTASAPTSASASATPTSTPRTLYLAAGQSLYALNLTTGAKRWTYTTGLHEQPGYNGISALAAASGVVYFHNIADNSLYALNASDGSLLWKGSVPQTASSTIVVTPSAIIVASLFDQSATSVAAVDPHTGKTLWTQPDTGPNALLVGAGIIYESYDASGPLYGKSGMAQAVNAKTGAVVWQATGHNYFDLALTNNLLYASGDDALHAFDASTGKELWSQSFNDATIASQPHGGAYYVHITQAGSTLYLANGATVYALNGATHTVMWQAALKGGSIAAMTSGVLCAAGSQTVEGLDPATGAVKWQAPVYNGYRGVADGGICYYPGLTSKISALDAQTGATRWTFNADDNNAQLIAYNGVVYVLANVFVSGVGADPTLHALAGSDGSTLWTLDTHAGALGGMTLG